MLKLTPSTKAEIFRTFPSEQLPLDQTGQPVVTTLQDITLATGAIQTEPERRYLKRLGSDDRLSATEFTSDNQSNLTTVTFMKERRNNQRLMLESAIAQGENTSQFDTSEIITGLEQRIAKEFERWRPSIKDRQFEKDAIRALREKLKGRITKSTPDHIKDMIRRRIVGLELIETEDGFLQIAPIITSHDIRGSLKKQ